MKNLLRILCAVSLLAGLVPSHAFSQSTNRPSPEEAKAREAWRIDMARTSPPAKGCFQSAYPSKEWQQVACKPAPKYPQPPRSGPRPLTVGNSDDVAARAPSGFISTAIGSFDSVSGVTSETGPIGNSGPSLADTYTLQLNTDFFTSTVCSGAGNPAICRGWQQFVFENNPNGSAVYIQYWIYKYNNPCPSGMGWNQFQFTGQTDIYCWKNDSMGVAPTPAEPITNLGHLSLSGNVATTGDSVTLFDGTTIVAMRAGDNAVNAAAGWRIAEFNIFGDGGNNLGGGTASFNAGSTVVPRTRIFYGGNLPPQCVAQGFTAEKNNLTFGPTAPASSGLGPAVFFTESSAGGATSNCAAATSIGDTHLDTVQGLFYDFQASGDFLVAQVDPDFTVQERQASGAPVWPDADVNKAIATRMGRSTVAICVAPESLYVNGVVAHVGETPLSLPDGIDITRRGNVYFITSQSGDSVRATVHTESPGWIDLDVGFGHWPATVKGILANANGNVNAIAAADGTVLTSPFDFTTFYNRYADSWRVSARESLLSVCGAKHEEGNPRKPFYAADLTPEVYQRTRSVCTTAGVKDPALLDACTLDVAVIGNNQAANVFVNARTPVAVGKIVAGTAPISPASTYGKWKLAIWLLLLLILIVIIIWIIKSRK